MPGFVSRKHTKAKYCAQFISTHINNINIKKTISMKIVKALQTSVNVYLDTIQGLEVED